MALSQPSLAKPRKKTAAKAKGSVKAKESTDVPAVAGAIKILRHLAASDTPVGVTHLARQLGLNPSTCFNILRTLLRADLVQSGPDAKTYQLGLGVLDLARVAFAHGGDFLFAQPMMRQLAMRHGVTITLWKPSGPERMLLALVVESDQVMRIRMSVGQRLPLLIGAMGRVNAAFGGMEEAELKRRFDGLRWERPFAFEQFAKEVAQARRRGWGMDDGDFVGGVTTISAPVFGASREILATCSASMFTTQHDEAQRARIASELIEVCTSIGRSVAFG